VVVDVLEDDDDDDDDEDEEVDPGHPNKQPSRADPGAWAWARPAPMNIITAARVNTPTHANATRQAFMPSPWS
jgi:hypothetical protein